MEDPRGSSSRLFEDGAEIGVAHTLHIEIEVAGAGRFSHWGNNLYFSSSDGTSPLANGRTYQLLLDHPAVTFAQALRSNVQTPQSELHCVLCWKLLSASLENCPGVDLGRVLEVGSYGHPGLALVLLMMGAEHVTLNNVLPVVNHLSIDYVENVAALLMACPRSRDWREVVEPADGGYRVRPGLVTTLGGVSFADIDLRNGSADIIFSLSVLGHIRDLDRAAVTMSRMLRHGGYMCHWIDCRDHTSFDDPLRYLRLSESEFNRTYSREHVRSRPSEYVRAMEAAGFQTIATNYISLNPVKNGTSDLLPFVIERPESFLHGAIGEITPVVTEADRAALHSDYRKYSLQELSVSALVLLSQRA